MLAILGKKFEPWRPRDLRRTVAPAGRRWASSRMLSSGFSTTLSAAQGGRVSVYQRYGYREERRRAIMAWGDYVMQLVIGILPASYVIRLERKR